MTQQNFVRTSKKIVALVAILSLFVLYPWSKPAQALGTMTTLRVYLNRQQKQVTTGVEFDLFFKPATNVSGGTGTNKVIFSFPNDANDNTYWCRTAGTDLVITGEANPTGSSAESATSLPGGTLTGVCAQSTPDTFTISGVDNLTAGTKYGVKITQKVSSPVAIIGTANTSQTNLIVTVKTNNGSADVDSGTLAIATIDADQVSVTASVAPTLTVTLSGTSAALGSLDTGHVNQAGVSTTITTNASGGYLSLVKYDHTLTSGSDTIADVSGTIAIGQAKFGASSSQSGNTIAQWNPTACTTTTSTSNATALTTAFQSYATSATPKSAEATTLCFLAGIAGTTPAGNYASTATIVTTGRF